MSLLSTSSTDDIAELHYITSLLQTNKEASGLDDVQKLFRKWMIKCSKSNGEGRHEDDFGDIGSPQTHSKYSINDVSISLFLLSRYHIEIDPTDVRNTILPGIALPLSNCENDADAGGMIDFAETVASLLMPTLLKLRGNFLEQTINLRCRSKLCRETAVLRKLKNWRRNSNSHDDGPDNRGSHYQGGDNNGTDGGDAFIVSAALEIVLATVLDDAGRIMPAIDSAEYPQLTAELVRVILENCGALDFFPSSDIPEIIDEIIAAVGGAQESGLNRRLDPHTFARLLTDDIKVLDPSDDDPEMYKDCSNDKSIDGGRASRFGSASIDDISGLRSVGIITVLLWIFLNLFVLGQVITDYSGSSFPQSAHKFGTEQALANGSECSSSNECRSSCCVWNRLGGKRCIGVYWFAECPDEAEEYDFVKGEASIFDSCAPHHQDAASKGGDTTLRIMSYNLYLILLASDGAANLDERVDKILDFFIDLGRSHRRTYDIVALQETWIYHDRIRDGMTAAGYCHHVYDDRGSFGSGLALYSKHPIVSHEFRGWRDACDGADCFADKGVIYARIDVNGQKVNVFNTHTIYNVKHNEIRRRQFKVMRGFVDERGNSSEPAFLVGDFNEDKIQTPELYKIMMDDLSAGDFTLDKSSSMYSYNPQNNSLIDPNTPGASSIQRALDFIFYDRSSASLTPQTNGSVCQYLQPKDAHGRDLSDHFPMSCDVVIDWSTAPPKISLKNVFLVDGGEGPANGLDGTTNEVARESSKEVQLISAYLSQWCYRTLFLIAFGFLSIWGGSLGVDGSFGRLNSSNGVYCTFTSIILLSICGLIPAAAYYWSDQPYNSVFWFAQLGSTISAALVVIIYLFPTSLQQTYSNVSFPTRETYDEATKNAAQKKLLNMVGNALQMHNINSSDEKEGDAMVKYQVAGTRNNDIHLDRLSNDGSKSIAWCWKRLLTGNLLVEDGIRISAKFLALNILLFLIPICFILSGVILARLPSQKSTEDVLNNGIELLLPLVNVGSVSHLENICAALASDLGLPHMNIASCLPLFKVMIREYLAQFFRVVQPDGHYVAHAPIIVGTIVATINALFLAVVFAPSVITTIVRLRSGRMPFWDDPIQGTLIRSRMDYSSELIGKLFWLGIFGPFLTAAATALFLFLLLWHISRPFVLRVIALMIGIAVTLGIRFIIGAGFVDSAYRGFYRHRVNQSNIAGLVVESITIGLGIASAAVRVALSQATLFFYIGRADKPIFDMDISIGLGHSVLRTRDNLPRSFLQGILIQEAHHHPYIETLGNICLMKLHHGEKFVTRAGYVMRLVFVMTLMPWLKVYRIAARQKLESCDLDIHDSFMTTKLSASKIFNSDSLRNFSSRRMSLDTNNMHSIAESQTEE